MRTSEKATGKPASWLMDKRIRDLGGWRAEALARMRALILEADPEIPDPKHLFNSSLKATREGRSTSTKARRSMRARSRRS